ncbi:MAG: AAA family ATPase, partial [Planctomycetota bacterium]|nr:AAA family ATPase [Planctomycetota bacterium]
MRTIAVLNQKGGVGKTTTVVNTAAALAAMGSRVVAIDLDPQAHLTIHLGLEPQT